MPYADVAAFAEKADLSRPWHEVSAEFLAGAGGNVAHIGGFGLLPPRVEGGRIPYDGAGLPVAAFLTQEEEDLYRFWARSP